MDSNKEENYKPITQQDLEEAIEKISKSPVECFTEEELDEAWTKKGNPEMAITLNQEDLKNTQEKSKMSIGHPDFMKPYRLTDETDSQYKARRIVQKLYIKQRKKGNLAWIAKDTRLPVREDPKDPNLKIVGYQVSEGFTYNKEKFNKAIEAWQKKQEELQLINKLKEEKIENEDSGICK